MWFPLHNRRSGVYNPVLLYGFCLTCMLISGCMSVPRFSGSDNIAALSADEIPAPVFDDEDSAEVRPRVASTASAAGLVTAPGPFQWETLATSAGDRDIEGITIGQGGYRTIILGSLAGDDPLAVSLTEKLAKHIYQNQIVLGGIQATIVRSPNPDGEFRFRMENENGVYLNRQFIPSAITGGNLQKQEPEVRFLLGMLQDRQPQRVIHIRTVSGNVGIVASSSGSSSVAGDVSRWLKFRSIELPGNSAEGTLERFLSQKKSCEIITFAIPQMSDKSTLWEDYGDSLLNLLLAEDFETRKLARENGNTIAADRRGRKDDVSKKKNSDD